MRGWISGWSNIADYIGRSIPTAKRYHYRFHMPVRRIPGMSPVCLSPELDMWLIEFDRLVKERREKENEPV